MVLTFNTKFNLYVAENPKATPADQGAASQSPTPTQVQSAGPVQTVVTALTAVLRSIRNFLGF